jgi:hypothetical protein
VSRLLALAPLLLLGAGCGAETVGSSEPVDTSSYRVEVQRKVAFMSSLETSISRDVVNGDSSTSVDDDGCRFIGIGETSYIEVPEGAGLPAGKHWIRADDDDDSEEWFEDAMEPEDFVRSDNVSEVYVLAEVIAYGIAGPGQYLAELRKDAEPQPVGEETIEGVATTHFRATVDDRRRVRRQLEEGGWKPKNIDAYLAHSDPSELIVDVWVDDTGVARRVRETSPSYVSTSTYSDFGHQEAIEPPPAAEVLEADEWARIQQEHADDSASGGEGSDEASCG